jgi:hypothetical protein
MDLHDTFVITDLHPEVPCPLIMVACEERRRRRNGDDASGLVRGLGRRLRTGEVRRHHSVYGQGYGKSRPHRREGFEIRPKVKEPSNTPHFVSWRFMMGTGVTSIVDDVYMMRHFDSS